MTQYFDVKQHMIKTRQGDIGLPILYYNTSCVFASFLVDTERARALLPAALEPLPIAPGKTYAAICFFQYFDSSVGPYNEMGLALAARPSARKGHKDTSVWLPGQSMLPGMYVLDLPVTTEVANAAGRECWGYPKIVVPIDFHLRGPELSCTVLDTGNSAVLCRLEGRTGAGLKFPVHNMMTYTCLDGKLLRTVIDMRGRMQYASTGSVRLDCGKTNHHLSRHLHQLGLQNATPVMVQSALGIQAILPAGEEVR